MASKCKQEALAALDAANKEYEEVCIDLKSKYEALDRSSDDAIILISDIEVLFESIRHRPWSYRATKRKIAVNMKKFIDSKELKRKERNNNIVAGAVGIAGGIGLLAYLKNICKKDVLRWILCLICIVFVLAVFFICKIYNEINTAKKACRQTMNVKKEIQKNRILADEASANNQKIAGELIVVNSYYQKLKNYVGCSYKELPEELKTELATLYNLALVLTELVNAQMG